MRQTLLMLAFVVASPLAMAQDPVGATTSSVIGADASQQPAAAVAESRKAPVHKPVSAIGRALSELLRDANRQPSEATPDHATTASGAPRDGDAARPTQQLVAKDEPVGGS